MASTRRLAAILAADVAGYSRLMGADEEGVHERVKLHFERLINPKITEHNGRVVKNTGDGALVEFASVVDAVRCAVEVQSGMIDCEQQVPTERRIRFRIGVNLGDIIIEEHDVFGDGVNIAARLEALAEPGGICISATVRDHIGNRLPYDFDDIGLQSLKNIERPVQVYVLRPEAVADLPASIAAHGTLISPLFLVPRLSIVVLPFANLSNDPEQQYFADGITEDLTSDLSRITDMVVISRNTAFTYQGKRVDTRQIGRELGVRYALEGSVRRSGNRIRINAQLIDAESDAHLWADRFDGDIGDLIALQDDVTSRIAVALNVALTAAEAARPTEHPDALDYIFRGRAAGWKPHSPGKYAEQIRLFERALVLNPRSVEAQSYLASALMSRVMSGMAVSAAADIVRAEGLVGQALTASPRSGLAHFAKGQVLRAQRRFEEAIPEYEMVIASNRNVVGALHPLGQCKLFAGSIEETIPLEEQAIRLSPRDPELLGVWYSQIGLVHLLQSRTEDAIVWFERARSANPERPDIRANLAAACALKGDCERAAVELLEARRLSADDRYTSVARLKAVGYWGVPKIRALFDATYFAALRKAGMAEE
jgi:TolB-like protein/class 3 adenylate cyclase